MIDPRTTRIASALMQDAMNEVAAGMLAGRDHYAERDRVLRELSGAWVEHAGKDAADQAVRGLHMLAPAEYLTAAERTGLRTLDAMQTADRRQTKTQRDAEYEAYLRRLAPHLLPKPRKPALRRVAAMVLLALAVALAGLLAGSSHVQAAPEPGARWKALAACGRATIGSGEYDRRCQRFSRTERSVTRDYDGPGAGAPRSWEYPKEWE